MTDMLYKRGQVVTALWQYFRFVGEGPASPPPIFRTRIKRLLEVDRSQDALQAPEGSSVRYAFFDETPGGQGTDVNFTLFNAVCLAWGLELLDVGFKQGEIVFLLRYLRQGFQKEFTHIVKNPPVPREKISVNERPRLPRYKDNKGEFWADGRVFVLLRKVEFTEMYPAWKKTRGKKVPLMIEPMFCHGITALTQELHQMNCEDYGYRKALVLELAHSVVMVQQYLQAAPALPRGRK